MQSSRDSSIWRSLAVAFGDGVAFGVGVKLAQGPNRPPAGAPPIELPPAADRLEQIDRRLSAVEKAPAPAVSLAPSAPAPFDQKVLEAVVNALDARLHEQSGKVESRIAELEARLAIELKNLERQDRSIVAGLQGRIDEVHGQYNEHVTAIRDAVAQDMADRRRRDGSPGDPNRGPGSAPERPGCEFRGPLFATNGLRRGRARG